MKENAMIENLCRWLAWKLPRRIARWAFYRVVAHATSGQWANETPVGMTWETAAGRWEQPGGHEAEDRSASTQAVNEGEG